MNDAHDVLGLPRGAAAAQVRARYLELVRANPPERAPERFARIHAAYQALEDPARALHDAVFEIDARDDSWDAVAAAARARLLSRRMTLQTLLALAELA